MQSHVLKNNKIARFDSRVFKQLNHCMEVPKFIKSHDVNWPYKQGTVLSNESIRADCRHRSRGLNTQVLEHVSPKQNISILKEKYSTKHTVIKMSV